MNGSAFLDRLFAGTVVRGDAVRYVLPVPVDARRSLAAGWLVLALVSLAASGVLSVLLVLSRTPGVKDIFPLVDFFYVALVAHVDLSVLLWFLAFAGVLWSINSTPRAIALGWSALALALLGSALIAAAPFVGAGRPVMANYIPVLDEPVFLSGLGLFSTGMALAFARGLLAVPKVGARLDGAGALRFGLNTSLVSVGVALLAFGWSFWEVPRSLEAKGYYELVFWGGGHVLQFTWTLLMFVAWLWLAEEGGAPLPLKPRSAVLLFGIGLVSVFLTPVIYLAWEVGSVEHHRLLTWLMRFGGGLAILPFSLALVLGLARAGKAARGQGVLRAALLASLLLFGAGGVIGLMISGSNVKIPAHYHGSIVGVTLAFMGLTYHLLPRLGFSAASARWAVPQLWLYAGGQLLHVLGLMWSGGYGVQRKVAGAAQTLRSTEEVIAMGVMGLGGLIAVIGGTLFLVLAIGAVLRRPGARREPDLAA
ncbi:MAG: cbb3-type cytochrome c oxidase subunit I [Betaproteobacteria bacterium]|nr:cbb3-type cytochrome c oxidase subunit I [Betaproteobacteria bacterium]